MKINFRLDEKKIERLKRNWPIIPCLLATILTGIHALGIWERLNFTAVNLLCLPLFFSELSQGIVGNKNRTKAQLFLASVFIGTVICGLDLWTDYRTLENFHVDRLSVWSLVWMALLAVAVILSVAVLIRIARWSQEKWEEQQNLRQSRRMAVKAYFAEYASRIGNHRLDMQELKQTYKKGKFEKKRRGKNIITRDYYTTRCVAC